MKILNYFAVSFSTEELVPLGISAHNC